MDRKFALGIDYGTNSVRALIVDVATGEEVGTHVHNYVRGRDGIILDERDCPHRFIVSENHGRRPRRVTLCRPVGPA